MPEPMDLERAMEIVLELARQNIADQLDDPKNHAEQEQACETVEYWFNSINN